MPMTFDVFVEPGDVQKFTEFVEGVERRMARAELLPIMVREFEPIVAAERAALEGHSKSGALIQSLKARSGSGDRPGTMSVFSTPSGTAGVLRKTWGSGRRQQQRWAAGVNPKGGRRRVFYAVPLHQGHVIMVPGPGGKYVPATHGKTMTDPVPFASDAADALGESVAESMGEAILKHIVEG